jgi:hypothetical protein
LTEAWLLRLRSSLLPPAPAQGKMAIPKLDDKWGARRSTKATRPRSPQCIEDAYVRPAGARVAHGRDDIQKFRAAMQQLGDVKLRGRRC